MDDRLKKYFQNERMHAIDEFVNELNNVVCDKYRYFRRDRWQQMILEVRQSMYEGRDRNADEQEPLLELCHCIGFESNGKVCKKKATCGPYCSKHAPKAKTF